MILIIHSIRYLYEKGGIEAGEGRAAPRGAKGDAGIEQINKLFIHVVVLRLK